MRNRKCMLALTITGIFVVALMLCASESLAMSGPPEGTHFQGPAIRGQFIFEDGDGAVPFSFFGTCGKADLEYEGVLPSDYGYIDIIEEALQDIMIPWPLVQIFTDACYPPAVDQGDTPTGLVIIQVQSFTEIVDPETFDQKIVEVIMLWAVP